MDLQSLLSLFAMVLIPLGVGGAGFLLLREAGVRAQRDQHHGEQAEQGLQVHGLRSSCRSCGA